MKRYWGSILATLGLLCFASATLRAQADNLPAEDSKGINQALAGYIDGFNSHDAHALAMWFTEDGDFVGTNGAMDHSKQAIEQRFVPRFNTTLKTVHRTYVVKTIRLLNPQIALLFATSEMSGRKAADGSDEPNANSIYEIVLAKQNGHWLISNFHEATLP